MIENNGRLVKCEFHINKTTNLLLVSIYRVVYDGSRDVSKNVKKNNLTRNIQNNLQSIKDKFLRKAKENNSTLLILIQGDLQDTVSRTIKDNVNTSGSEHITH